MGYPGAAAMNLYPSTQSPGPFGMMNAPQFQYPGADWAGSRGASPTTVPFPFGNPYMYPNTWSSMGPPFQPISNPYGANFSGQGGWGDPYGNMQPPMTMGMPGAMIGAQGAAAAHMQPPTHGEVAASYSQTDSLKPQPLRRELPQPAQDTAPELRTPTKAQSNPLQHAVAGNKEGKNDKELRGDAEVSLDVQPTESAKGKAKRHEEETICEPHQLQENDKGHRRSETDTEAPPRKAARAEDDDEDITSVHQHIGSGEGRTSDKGIGITLSLEVKYEPITQHSSTQIESPYDEQLCSSVRWYLKRNEPMNTIRNQLLAEADERNCDVREIDMYLEQDDSTIAWNVSTTPSSLQLRNGAKLRAIVRYKPRPN